MRRIYYAQFKLHNYVFSHYAFPSSWIVLRWHFSLGSKILTYSPRLDKRAFTLIEVLVTVVVTAMIAWSSILLYKQANKTKKSIVQNACLHKAAHVLNDDILASTKVSTNRLRSKINIETRHCLHFLDYCIVHWKTKRTKHGNTLVRTEASDKNGKNVYTDTVCDDIKYASYYIANDREKLLVAIKNGKEFIYEVLPIPKTEK